MHNIEDAFPSPRPGFETELLQEVQGLVSGLAPGIANLRVGRVPGHPDWSEPYFDVTPTNPKAARLEGIAAADDLTLIIGEAEREFPAFARGGSIVHGASWREELRWIWEAVRAGGFTQHHFLDSHGNLIGWSASFLVNGHNLVFRNGRRAERLFGQSKIRNVTYEPYELHSSAE